MPPSKAQRAKTAARRTQAIQLRLAGTEWQQIADALGYASRAAAYVDVNRALEKALAEQRTGAEVLRETELLRLDRLQRGLWPTAVAGDTKAADTVLRIIDRRMRLLGLDVPPDVEERLRQELVAKIGAQMYMVFGQVMDGLRLSEEQRGLVPGLLEQAILAFTKSERRAIEGELVDGDAA